MASSLTQRRKNILLISVASSVMIFVTIMVTLFILSNDNTPITSPTKSKTTLVAVTPIDLSSSTAAENKKEGSVKWVLDSNVNTKYIQGYASTVSAAPGDTVGIFVSSVASVNYHFEVYRIGWYNGAGGHLYYLSPTLTSEAQGYWTEASGLVCSRCKIDPTTHEIDANWKKSADLAIGAAWPSGAYLVKLVSDSNRAQSYIPLVVRTAASHSSLLVSLPVNTYAAYNMWGGYNLYEQYQASGIPFFSKRASHVSFNRPYERSAGASDFLSWDIHTIRFLERSGYDVSYSTNVDMDAHPEELLQHRIFVSVGHDEYWTKSMRDGAEAARDKGVSLAFFGANDAYWQARIEPDATSSPARVLVSYKVQTKVDLTGPNGPTQQLKNDPVYPAHPELVTAQWRDPVINRPENALLGIMYSSYFNTAGYAPEWIVSSGPADALFTNTDLKPGQHIKGGFLGYEYDAIDNNGFTPKNLVILAESPIRLKYGKSNETANAHTAYYYAPSGAMVFDAGSIWWGWGLDDFTAPGADQSNFFKGNNSLIKLTDNILKAMLIASPMGGNPTPLPTSTVTASPTPKR